MPWTHLLALLCLASGITFSPSVAGKIKKKGLKGRRCVSSSTKRGCVKSDSCPDGWLQFSNKCFIYYSDHREWGEAESFCMDIGGNLAKVEDIAEVTFLNSHLKEVTKEVKRVWIGGHDKFLKGQWMWTDGSAGPAMGWKLWSPGQPSDSSGAEHCMEMNYLGGMNDDKCHEKKPFICSRPTRPL
ncbi:galactose-specific lectin nattectin-like [Solea solea]|uniref:galactose-specific lectin nattectin-like n=1 Tax=Solea solea TaxID=90069 RepID=UPI00272BD5BA|nr:galactose-specific lectin nattectin-like [Solea solea]